jgi:hypothetical protein
MASGYLGSRGLLAGVLHRHGARYLVKGTTMTLECFYRKTYMRHLSGVGQRGESSRGSDRPSLGCRTKKPPLTTASLLAGRQ